MAEDHYKTLEISRSATPDEIQKAYRKLARKFHPDLHADKSEKEKDRAKQQFQKIQTAYDVLNDPKKREMYDRFGDNFESFGGGAGPQPGGQPPFGNMDIDFSQIFGAGGPNAGPKNAGGFENLFRHFGGMGPGAPQPPAEGRDVEQEITISFHTAIKGGTHQIALQRADGKVERISIKIPVGMADNKKIRLRGQGEMAIPGGPRGDLLVKVRVAKHPFYTRKGKDLHISIPVTLKEAIFGEKIDVPTPEGTVSLTVPKGSTSGNTLRLKGMGVKTKDGTGDVLVKLQIHIPENVSPEDEKLLDQLSAKWNDKSLRDKLNW